MTVALTGPGGVPRPRAGQVWTTPGGVVLIGRGPAGRWEVAVEVEPSRRGHGLGRVLVGTARHLLPRVGTVGSDRPGERRIGAPRSPAVGFTPVRAEALFVEY